MYVGRLLVVGPDLAAYRVSSRSFPHRRIVEREVRSNSDGESGQKPLERDDALTVVPTEDAPVTANPYVSYNCLRLVRRSEGSRAVLGNGSHVDPIAEKLGLGYPARDALAESLLALDYEKDDYDTPRIAGVVRDGSGEGTGSGDGRGGGSYVGIVRHDALLVEQVTEPTLVATYERDDPEPVAFEAATAQEAARAAYDLDFEHPVCAAAVARTDGGFEVAIENGQGDGN